MFRKSLVIFFLFFVVTRCSPPSGPHHPTTTPSIKIDSAESISYDQVKPIFANACAACHPSRAAPNWLDPAQAKKYALNGKLVSRVVTERSMPPPGSSQAAAMTEKDRQLLVAWANAGAPLHAGVVPKNSPEVNPGNPITNANLTVQSCLQCHGANGPSLSQPLIPKLSGQNKEYLKIQMNQFKWRKRIDPSQTMNEIALPMSEDEIEKVSDFFSKQPGFKKLTEAPILEDREKELFLQGQKYSSVNCASCHMNPEFQNRTTVNLLPVLTGQSKSYLMNQLIYFRGNERSNSLMHTLTKKLSDSDIEAIATYFSLIGKKQ